MIRSVCGDVMHELHLRANRDDQNGRYFVRDNFIVSIDIEISVPDTVH